MQQRLMCVVELERCKPESKRGVLPGLRVQACCPTLGAPGKLCISAHNTRLWPMAYHQQTVQGDKNKWVSGERSTCATSNKNKVAVTVMSGVIPLPTCSNKHYLAETSP